ncbi:MAG: hypothetical protein HKO87_09230 [Acidimicrobiia bacterium]|nr:hypothetical protein [Acidimicrobiia bacterium]
MTTTSRPDLDFARRELLDLCRDRDWARSRARAADADVVAMRRVAIELERTIEPLRTALQPIAGLHTTPTWEGQAATASRTRLARLDEKRTSAVSSIDHLIAELRTTASRRETTADAHWGDYATYSRQVHGLEDMLGIAPFDQIR